MTLSPDLITPAPPLTSKVGKRKTLAREFENEISKKAKDNLGKNAKAKYALQSYLKSSTCRGVAIKTIEFKNNSFTSNENLVGSDQVEDKPSYGTTTKPMNGNPMAGDRPKNFEKTDKVADLALSTDMQPEEAISAGSSTRKNLGTREKVTEIVKGPTGHLDKETNKLSFIENVEKLMKYPLSPIGQPPFNCNLSENAAEDNLKIL